MAKVDSLTVQTFRTPPAMKSPVSLEKCIHASVAGWKKSAVPAGVCEPAVLVGPGVGPLATLTTATVDSLVYATDPRIAPAAPATRSAPAMTPRMGPRLRGA